MGKLFKRDLVLAAAATALATVACGGSGSEEAESPGSASPGPITSATADQRQAVVSAVLKYEQADTPEALCATITRGLEVAIKGHGAAPVGLTPAEAHSAATASCPDAVKSAESAGDLQLVRTKASVSTVLLQLDRAAALVNEAGLERPFFLVNVSGQWLINNFGSAPPDFRELADALKG